MNIFTRIKLLFVKKPNTINLKSFIKELDALMPKSEGYESWNVYSGEPIPEWVKETVKRVGH